MSFRHKVSTSAALALAVATLAGAPASADDAVSLASVARELGFSYAYLPYENAVSLHRPGATVVVRPGDPFFSANERREPVYGMVPVYRRNDVYVSRAFIDEIRGLGRQFAGRTDRTERAEISAGSLPVVAQAAPAQATSGSVTALVATYDAKNDAILVSGHATAGSRVTLAVKATLADALPVVTVERAATYAAADGSFAGTLSFGADQFSESHYVVEARGSDDAVPVVAKVPARRPVSLNNR